MDVSYAAKKRAVIILKLTSRPSLSLLLCSTYLQYLGPTILLRPHVLTYFFMISRKKYTKNVLVGSPAVSVRDEIHCNEYPGTRRVMNVGYPGSKFSTRFNPTRNPYILIHILKYSSAFTVLGVRLTKYQQIHTDTQPDAQQMFTFLFTYLESL